MRTKLGKSAAAALACAFSPDKMEKAWGGEGERELVRKLPLLTLCIFNINVIKAASRASLRGQREAGRAWGEGDLRVLEEGGRC